MDEIDRERFSLSYVFIDDCWIWFRSLVKDGYGSIRIAGRTRRAHRVSYELAYGVVLSPDQFLHHICKNKACVNPLHLEITTQAPYVDSAIYGNKEKTHCPYGHEYTEANTCWRKNKKQRECMTCKLARMKRRQVRIQQAAAEKLEALALKCRLTTPQ
ncbi:MAG: hypothetical protein ACRYFS_23425 [Janthinobacterium lividum]